MYLEQLIFYAFAALVIGSGLLMILQRNPVNSALFLVLAFFGSSALWMLLSAEFLSLVLVFVYVGAVMTLFIFVVMMLNLNTKFLKGGFVKFLPLAGLIVAGMVGIMLYVLSPGRLKLTTVSTVEPANYSNIKSLGAVLYTEYAYPFELAAVLLLVAIISAIGLCHIEKKRRKTQSIPDQLQVKRDEQVKLISMKSEKKH